MVAGCPCVRDSKDKDFVFLESALSSLRTPFIEGTIIFSTAPFVIKEYAVLLISSDVRPRCTSGTKSFRPAFFSFSDINTTTAFTSWLVFSSIFFICLKSFAENSTYRFFKEVKAFLLKLRVL